MAHHRLLLLAATVAACSAQPEPAATETASEPLPQLYYFHIGPG